MGRSGLTVVDGKRRQGEGGREEGVEGRKKGGGDEEYWWKSKATRKWRALEVRSYSYRCRHRDVM